ncbi:MAG: 6-phosphogluconolactonase [Phycisphaerae bacterium]|nr:6-phosphogluconolactonase [Phycisphaerae bacterium]
MADLLCGILRDAVEQRGACWLALAGGTTPRSLYRTLADRALAEDLPWSRAEFFFTDERDVPHDDVDSNYGMAQRLLLDHVPVPGHQVHPMPADAPDLAAAAAEYEQTLRRHVPPGPNGLPQFDVVLLGMGADGHVASLFPDLNVLNERERLVAADFIPQLGRNRMTLTFPVINAARNVILLVTGEDKADAVAGVLSDDALSRRRFPASGVGPVGGGLYVAVDAPAARKANLRGQTA